MFEGDKLQTGCNWISSYELSDFKSFNDLNVGRDEFCFSSSIFEDEDASTFYLSQPATQSLPLVNCPICGFSFIGPVYADHYARCFSHAQSLKSTEGESNAFSTPVATQKRKTNSRPADPGANKKVKKATPNGKRPSKASGGQVAEPKRRVDVKYDPDKHCGVWIMEQERHCTRSLSCKAHPIAKRRMVPDRSDGFDTMLAAHRAARKNVERRDSGPTLETIDKARSEGDKLPTQPHTSLPITSCTLQRPPTPLPSVDTPPSNEIQFRSEGPKFNNFDTLLGDDDFLDEFKDLPGVDCFLGTPVSQVSSDSPMSQDSSVSDGLLSGCMADVAGHISLSEELARCFSAIPMQYYTCTESKLRNQPSPSLNATNQPSALHNNYSTLYHAPKVDMHPALPPQGKVGMQPGPLSSARLQMQLRTFQQNAIKRHKSSISNVETKLPDNVLALISKSSKRQHLKRKRVQRHPETAFHNKGGRFPDAIACCT